VSRTKSNGTPRPASSFTPLLRKTALCSALAMALGAGHVAQAQAQDKASSEVASDYAIPAGPLANTLREIARVSGRTVRFEARDVENRRAPALTGPRSAVAAIQEAISNSGLTMKTLGSGELVVFVPELDTVQVTATRGEAEMGFKASRSETSTRSGADLMDVPQAVTIVTAKVMETQQSLSVQDVLQNVAGVVTTDGGQGLPGYSIRGFTQTGTLSNGVTDPFSGASNVAGIDRVEVLKGPQAILSGGDSLGGAVNIVNKKPTAETVRDVALQYGSFQDKRASLDLAGALTEDKHLSYRLILSEARADRNDAGYKGETNDYLLAQVRWKDATTDLNVGTSYDNSRFASGGYTFALNGGLQETPQMRLGDADDGVLVRSKGLFYSLEHAFSPEVTLVSRMQRTLTTQDLSVHLPRFPMSIEDMLINFGESNQLSNFGTTSGDHYLRLNFATGPLAHTLSTGINHTSQKQGVDEYTGGDIPVAVYQSTQAAFPRLVRDASTLYSRTKGQSTQTGVYVQDSIRWNDWNALVGVRRTNYKSGPNSNEWVQFNETTHQDKTSLSQTTPSVGLVYNLSANSSVYSSYAEGFLPQFVTVRPCGGGTDFDPMETVNKEVGFKHNSDDGAFAFSAALFQLDQSNRLEENRANNCYSQKNGQRLRGTEFEASGRLADGLNMILNYTYADAKDLTNKAAVPGAQPRHQANLWTTYDFQSEALRGFGVSLGLSAYSKTRLGSTEEAPMAPGGMRMDAGLSYTQKDWSLRLGVKNLLDRNLYGYSATEIYVPVQSGRTFSVTFRKSL